VRAVFRAWGSQARLERRGQVHRAQVRRVSRNRVVARMRLGAAVRPPRARHRPGKDKRRSPAEIRPPPAAVGRRVAHRNKVVHRAAARRVTRARRAKVGPAADR